MYKKIEVNYLRDLKSYPLNKEDLKKILIVSKNIRLIWGAEYVDFRFSYPLEEKITEITYELFSEKFMILSGIIPENGSSSILVKVVPVKSYSLEEFCEISKSSDCLVAMSVPSSIYKDTSKTVDILQKVLITTYIDYPGLVTKLEEYGYIITYPSQNILRTDERKFSLSEKAMSSFPKLKKYIGETFEVDSLGTTYHSELSEDIILLSSRYFKALEKEEQTD